MSREPLNLLQMVDRGPCHELDDRPFGVLRGLKANGWLEPYHKTFIPGWGPSTKWTFSPQGRAEMKRLAQDTPQ